MKNHNPLRLWMMLALLVPVAVSGQERKRLSKHRIPLPVQQEFNKTYTDASIERCEIEQREGKVQYHIEARRGGRELEVVYGIEVKELEAHEDIPIARLPGPVASSINAEYPTAAIVEAEEITKSGSVVGYEVEIKHMKRDIELTFDSAGKILDRKLD
jgi:uncharacterized membrane protein YkoI